MEVLAYACLVVAVDAPVIREIAGLSDLEDARATGVLARGAESLVASSRKNIETSGRPPASGVSGRALPGTPRRTRGRYDGATSCLEGGLVLVEILESANQEWTAVRMVAAMTSDRRAAASQALVRWAKAFDSWKPLADTLVKAVVD